MDASSGTFSVSPNQPAEAQIQLHRRTAGPVGYPAPAGHSILVDDGLALPPRPLSKWPRYLAVLIATAAASTAVPAVDSWRPVRGADLRPAFASHELADGVHYAYQFSGEGTFSGYEMARAVRGTWRANGNEFCWTWLKPAGAEECFKVERNGADIRLLRDGNEVLFGKLSRTARQLEKRGAP